MALLKYLSNFWLTLEMLLINYEINLDLSWSVNCVIVATDIANQGATFSITGTKLYVPVVSLRTQDNAKLFKQLKSGFRRTIKWNKNHRLLIDSSFQGVNRLFVLSFENNAQRTSYKQYFFPTVEIKDYNVMIDGKNVFDQPAKNKLRTYDSIKRIATAKGDGYTTVCSIDYNYLKDYYKMIAIDLSKKKHLMLIQKQYNKLIL